jgi:hypothetical protein
LDDIGQRWLDEYMSYNHANRSWYSYRNTVKLRREIKNFSITR